MCLWTWERELWRAYNYIRDTTGYFVCVRGSYIHVLYKFLGVCVSMVRHYVFLGVRIDLAWTEVLQASKWRVWGWEWKFYTVILNFWSPCILLSGRHFRSLFRNPLSLFFFIYGTGTEEDTHLWHVCLRVRAVDLMKSIIKHQSIVRSR